MKTVVGILRSKADAELTAKRLRELGIRQDNMNILSPDASRGQLARVATTEAEQPGMGSAMGSVVGGALGAAGGMGLGAAVASMLVPGVGGVMAMGLAGAAILAAGGAAGGAVAGEALEDSMARGLPVDELFVYEDALRQGRTVVIVFAKDEEQAEEAREVMRENGAEAVDAARETWWATLRYDEKQEYSKEHEDFDKQETIYRHGFESALHPGLRGKSYREAASYLGRIHPEEVTSESFRRGFQRGREHYYDLIAAEN